jgi:predicted DNA-binding transcriptional regulator YafY
MKINRLLEIMTILLNQETITAKELANRFEVSLRTIYRDVDALSSAGVPVYTNRGKGGGISLLENFTLNKTLLSKSESESLLLSLKAMSATNYPEVNAIIDKIGSVFKGNQAQDWIEVRFDGWSNKAGEQNKFSKIRDAIIGSRIISFDYVNSNGYKSSRQAEPVKLIFIVNTWYLTAYCLKRNAQRMFRLSRIKNIIIEDEYFEKRAAPGHQGHDRQGEDWHRGSVHFVELKLCCDEKVLSRLYDNFDDDNIMKNEDGSYDLTVLVPEDEWVYGFIMSLGSYAEVLEPIHIREVIKERAQKIIEKYSQI